MHLLWHRSRDESPLLVIGLPSAPLHIPGAVARECAVWENLASSTVLSFPNGTRWTLSVSIPSKSSTIGARVTLQSVYDPLPLSLSNALQLTAGN